MENFPAAEQRKQVTAVPDQEQADLALSPVSREEMETELKAMREALAESDQSEKKESLEPGFSEITAPTNLAVEQPEIKDLLRLAELREKLNPLPETLPETEMEGIPPEQPPMVGEGDGELEPRILNTLDVKYETCRNCAGKGSVLFGILRCPKCGGSGSAPSLKQNWKKKIIGYQRKNSQ